MQPPTRGARRNGSGIAPGRNRGRIDGAAAARADGAGRASGGQTKTRAAKREPGCIKQVVSDVIEVVDVIGKESGQHFCRGSEPCVHRFDCPGGGPICAACCRAGFSHSRLQETSAGRNLITLFMTVNNPADFFLGPLPGSATPSSPRARFENPRALRRVRPQLRSSSLKPKRGAGFSALTFFLRGFSRPRAMRASDLTDDAERLYRKKKFRSMAAADFASHKPDCAKVRELFSASTGARRRSRRSSTPTGAPSEMPLAAALTARAPPRAQRRVSARAASATRPFVGLGSPARAARVRVEPCHAGMPPRPGKTSARAATTWHAQSRPTRARTATAAHASGTRGAKRHAKVAAGKFAASARRRRRRREVGALHMRCTNSFSPGDGCGGSASKRRCRRRAARGRSVRVACPSRGRQAKSAGIFQVFAHTEPRPLCVRRALRTRCEVVVPMPIARTAASPAARADTPNACAQAAGPRRAGIGRAGPADARRPRQGPRAAAMPLRIRTSRARLVRHGDARAQTQRGASPGRRDRGPVLRSPLTVAVAAAAVDQWSSSSSSSA